MVIVSVVNILWVFCTEENCENLAYQSVTDLIFHKSILILISTLKHFMNYTHTQRGLHAVQMEIATSVYQSVFKNLHKKTLVLLKLGCRLFHSKPVLRSLLLSKGKTVEPSQQQTCPWKWLSESKKCDLQREYW